MTWLCPQIAPAGNAVVGYEVGKTHAVRPLKTFIVPNGRGFTGRRPASVIPEGARPVYSRTCDVVARVIVDRDGCPGLDRAGLSRPAPQRQ
jgi:hypothetical protein